ncbi:flagellar basal body P-ring formation chaperone FlgA [Aeoliella sp.]|uniref:flagellar basal body P-ring formation chaperone FlgA n=1 Tax=Aeoliella sp. TaxID=2795800 RepID=UPI003CCB85BA
MNLQLTTKLIALATFIAMMVDGSRALAADIVLREKVTPVKSVISLGDIADIRGASEAQQQRLALVPLWVAPPVGEKRFVTTEQVREVLKSRGYAATALNVYGAPRVAIGWDDKPRSEQAEVDQPTAEPSPIASNSMGFRVPSTVGPLDAVPTATRRDPLFLSAEQQDQFTDQVRDAVVRYLEDQTGKIGLVDVEFKLPRRHGELLAKQQGEVVASGGRSPWFGRQLLELSFDSEKGTLKLPLNVTVYDQTPVLVAKRPLARGQLITAADVAIETPPHDARVSSNHTMIYSLEEALGHEAARAIREGDVVTDEMCLPPLMISRNEIVEVVSASGGISIRRQVKALSDARQGEVTEVQLLDSRERLVARVVGPGQLATLGSTLATPQSGKQRSATSFR